MVLNKHKEIALDEEKTEDISASDDEINEDDEDCEDIDEELAEILMGESSSHTRRDE